MSNNKQSKKYEMIADRYQEIFNKQIQFTNKMGEQWKGKPFNCYNFIKLEFDLFYSIDNAIEELGEARRLLNRKAWKKSKIDLVRNKKKILEELIDAEKFINQCKILLGYNANDSFKFHMNKDKVNHKRQSKNY